MDINRQLQEIYEKYNICDNTRISDVIDHMVANMLTERYKNVKYIYTDNEHQEYLKKYDIPQTVLTNSSGMEDNCSVIVLFYNRDIRRIEDELYSKNIHDIIDMYEEIRFSYNYFVVDPIYILNREFDYSYYYLNDKYAEWCKTGDANALNRFITLCLIRKDFLTAFKYMNIYINNGFTGYEKFIALKSEINNLLDEIKKNIDRRKHKDVIINWIDQFCYEDISKTIFLKKESQNSTFIKKAYTCTPYTFPTIRYVFWGERMFDGRFIRNIINRRKCIEDSPFVSAAKENGYSVFFSVPDEGNNTWVPYMNSNTNCASTVRYWDALDILTKVDNPVVIIIDLLRESHEPFFYPELVKNDGMVLFRTNYDDNEVQDRIDDALKYIDTEIGFYSEFFNDSMLKVYMSDHGKWNKISDRRFHDRALHCLMFICGYNTKKEVIDGLFPLSDLYKLIFSIMNNKKYYYNKRRLFFSDTYIFNKNLIHLLEERDMANKKEIQSSFCGEITEQGKTVYVKKTREIKHYDYGELKKRIDIFMAVNIVLLFIYEKSYSVKEKIKRRLIWIRQKQ